MRLIVTDLSQAVCVLSISQPCGLPSRFPDLVQPEWPPHGHTCPLSSHERPAQLPLTAVGAVATAARGTSRLLEASIPDWSIQPPSRAGTAATAWPCPCRSSEPAVARAGVRSHAGGKNYSRHDTGRAAAAGHPPPCRGWSPVAPPRPHAGASTG